MKDTTRERGNKAEDLACRFLIKQNLKLLQRNYYSKKGEIDLIMQHQSILVFIEVRFRKNTHFISPLETIDARKCQRIIATAEHYLLNEKRFTDFDIRFDVVLINGTLAEPEIEWIQDAFQA